MTLLQLIYFETLARVLHYTKAAEELHISQPSLSYSIAELEKELGVSLFQREKRKIFLTPYGERFLPYVQKTLALLEEGKETVRQMKDKAPLNVRLGYFHSISASLIPPIVKALYQEKENQNIRFQFAEDTSYNICELLKNGKLDLAFTTGRDEALESVMMTRQPLYLTVYLEHPLAKKSSVSFSDFASEPMILLNKTSSLRTQLDHAFIKRSVIPHTVFEVQECNTALQYVALKFGVSILPEVPAMHTERVVAIPINENEQDFFRNIYLSWDRTRPLSPVVKRVRNWIVQHYATSSPL
jgi:DNA-binding transcriptional LysR family regulator